MSLDPRVPYSISSACRHTTTIGGFRAVLFIEQYGEHQAWVGICLEHDIAAQALSREELITRLECALFAHEAIAREMGKEPYQGFGPSPQRYHDLWESAEKVSFDPKRATSA